MTHVETAVAAIRRLKRRGPYGDILVFMPTEQDIRETCEILEGDGAPGERVMPLFARLTADEQARVFARTKGRKIIVATNVAETSLTIPGIRYVVDSGLARVSQYNPRTRTTALPVEPISRSSADQRKGRCGRVENGVCIRLYSEEDYLSRPLFTPPEILRSNLAEVILRMTALKLGDMAVFPFIDRPAAKSIRDGTEALKELGAVTENLAGEEVQKASGGGRGKERRKGRRKADGSNSRPGLFLTKRGALMARLPIDPRLSRMLIEAGKQGCVAEVTVIAAALSIQDPRERPADRAEEADRAQALFVDPASDFLTLVNIWNRYQETWREQKTTGQMKKFCRAHFLSYRRMREWRDIHVQLNDILAENGLVTGGCSRSGPRWPLCGRPQGRSERLFIQYCRQEGKKCLSSRQRTRGNDLSRLSSVQPGRRLDRGGRDDRDEPPVCPHDGHRRFRMAGRTGRISLPIHVFEPALGCPPGGGRRQLSRSASSDW